MLQLLSPPPLILCLPLLPLEIKEIIYSYYLLHFRLKYLPLQAHLSYIHHRHMSTSTGHHILYGNIKMMQWNIFNGCHRWIVEYEYFGGMTYCFDPYPEHDFYARRRGRTDPCDGDDFF